MWLGGLSHSSQQHVCTDLFNLEATCRVQRLNWDTDCSLCPLHFLRKGLSPNLELTATARLPASQPASSVFPRLAQLWRCSCHVTADVDSEDLDSRLACAESILLQVPLLVPVLLHFCRLRKSELEAHASSLQQRGRVHSLFPVSGVCLPLYSQGLSSVFLCFSFAIPCKDTCH